MRAKRIGGAINKLAMRIMHPNSIDTYNKEVKPTLSKRQAEVLEVLKRFDKLTSFEVSMQLSITQEREVPLNTISGRFSELRDKGLIEEAGKRTIKGNNFTVWKVVKPKPVVNPGVQGSINF
jgi:predicted transcriptional regulator